MPTQEELAAFAERLHARGRATAASNKLRRSTERERLAGHSTCPVEHDHYRADCCPRCTERWGNLPQDASSIPFEAFSDHDKANYTEEDWAQVARIEAEWDEYLANWTPENCRHEFCAITDDNREICEWCGRDVTDPDFLVAEVEIARERAADYDRRMAERVAVPEDKTWRIEQKAALQRAFEQFETADPVDNQFEFILTLSSGQRADFYTRANSFLDDPAHGPADWSGFIAAESERAFSTYDPYVAPPSPVGDQSSSGSM